MIKVMSEIGRKINIWSETGRKSTVAVKELFTLLLLVSFFLT